MSNINRNNLPALPVPELCQSLGWYLKCLKPLVGENEFAKATAMAEHFCHNDGAVLQDKLLTYSRSIAPNSWLMPYSRDIYLTMREPVTLVGNYLLELSQPKFSEKYDYLEFVAVMAHCIGLLYLEILHDTLPDMTLKETPLCMNQFKGAFRGTKIPQKNKDVFAFFKDIEEVHSFGVFYKNSFYAVRLIDAAGHVYSIDCIRNALQRIYQDKGDALDVNWNVIAFAGSDRAAELIAAICEDEVNKNNMDVVHQTMFNIALSDLTSIQHNIAAKLFGNTDDIWIYKHWSITAYQDKVCSFNNEHTYIDGVNNLYLINRLLDKMQNLDANFLYGTQSAPLTPVNFSLSPQIRQQLIAIKSEYMEKAGQLSIIRYVREKLCIEKTKANKLNVDCCFQLAFQYAQLKAFNTIRTTHESVSVTQYYEGRTSCIRSVSEESVQFVKALLDNEPKERLADLIQKASREHLQKITKAKDFCCFIRHAAGLEIMYDRFGHQLGIQQKPAIFSDDCFITYCTQHVSTSTTGNTLSIDTFAFAPVAAGGLGLGYITQSDRLIVAISFYGDDKARVRLFEQALDEFFDKLEKLLA